MKDKIIEAVENTDVEHMKDVEHNRDFKTPNVVEIQCSAIHKVSLSIYANGVWLDRTLQPLEIMVIPYYPYVLNDLKPYLDKNLIFLK